MYTAIKQPCVIHNIMSFSNLWVRVFAPLCWKECHRHEVLLPLEVVQPFLHSRWWDTCFTLSPFFFHTIHHSSSHSAIFYRSTSDVILNGCAGDQWRAVGTLSQEPTRDKRRQVSPDPLKISGYSLWFMSLSWPRDCTHTTHDPASYDLWYLIIPWKFTWTCHVCRVSTNLSLSVSAILFWEHQETELTSSQLRAFFLQLRPPILMHFDPEGIHLNPTHYWYHTPCSREEEQWRTVFLFWAVWACWPSLSSLYRCTR